MLVIPFDYQAYFVYGQIIDYPGYRLYDNRYWFDEQMHLYEKNTSSDEVSDLKCIEIAVYTAPMSMPHNSYRYGKDIKIINNIPDIPENIGIIVVSHRLNQEATLLHHAEQQDPLLFLSSLIKKMCPNILVKIVKHENRNRFFYNYLIFQIPKKP